MFRMLLNAFELDKIDQQHCFRRFSTDKQLQLFFMEIKQNNCLQ